MPSLPSPLNHQYLVPVFAAVEQHNAAYGVVPLENSTNGTVAPTALALTQIPKTYPSVKVIAKTSQPIHHYLLGNPKLRKETSAPEEAAGSMPKSLPIGILRVLTHPQVWTQCSTFLAQNLAGIERVDTASTADAARIVSEDVSGASVAIAGAKARDLYGLTVLSEGIEDHVVHAEGDEIVGNRTLFLVLGRNDGEASWVAHRDESELQTSSPSK
ncbi:MAG: hypothetical protein M1825_003808 [Sarcosagium campestre]|nr:MAG: hypothetical protein M1825_003808 [Sarcosagium campestre]